MIAQVRTALSKPLTFIVMAVLIFGIGILSILRMPVNIFRASACRSSPRHGATTGCRRRTWPGASELRSSPVSQRRRTPSSAFDDLVALLQLVEATAAELERLQLERRQLQHELERTDAEFTRQIDAGALKEEVELFDRAIKLVKSLRPREKAGKKVTIPFTNCGLERQARSFLAQWLCEIRKDPSVSEQILSEAFSRS